MSVSATAAGWLTGYIPDLPMPFNSEGAVDLRAFAGLCRRQIDAGVSALVVCETCSEASTLSSPEYEAVIRTAVEAASGQVRVIAGAGSNATNRAIELTRQANAAGADAILSVVPYYNKPTQGGICAHFRAIADATSLPIILHDIPSRTMRELADGSLVRLAQSPQFVGLRDATGDIARVACLKRRLPDGFRLLSGDDATALAFVVSGGDGCISITANVVPELCRAIFSSCRRGRLRQARRLHDKLLPLTAFLSRDNPAALKHALSMLGLMQPDARLPIVELDSDTKAALARSLTAVIEGDRAAA
jgi:4-hydroxy-tetrahydrodipicolinate synthase